MLPSAMRSGPRYLQHRALYEALRSRQIEIAVGTITEHLEKARRDLLGADNG